MTTDYYCNVQIPVQVRRDGTYQVFAVDAKSGDDVHVGDGCDGIVTHWVYAALEIPRPVETTACHVEEVKK